MTKMEDELIEMIRACSDPAEAMKVALDIILEYLEVASDRSA